jgi:WD40 repeat protein
VATTIAAHAGAVNGLAFSPDGLQILTCGADKLARLWTLPNGVELQRFTQPAVATGVALSADGRTAAILAEDGHLRALPIAAVAAILGHEGAVSGVAYHPGGAFLLSGGADKTVRLWNLSNLADVKQERSFEGSAAAVNDVAISPDGAAAAACGADMQARTWNLNDASAVGTFALPASASGLAFNNNGQRLAVAADDNLLRVYDLTVGALLEQFAGHAGPVTSVAYSGDGLTIASGGADNSARLWTPVAVRAKPAHAGRINQVLFSADGGQVFTSGDDMLVAQWNTADFNQLKKFEGATAPVKALARSGDNQWLAGGGEDKQVRLWNIGSGQIFAQTESSAPVAGIALSSDGKKVVTAGADHVLRNYAVVQAMGQIALEKVQESTGHTAAVTGLALAADGRALFTASLDGSARRWVAANRDARFNLAGHQSHVYALAFSPDGTKLASASADKTIKLWNTADGANYGNCAGHTGPVYGVMFHPTQDQLASCSGDKTIRLWSSINGAQIKEVKEEITDGLYSIEYSADGAKLLTGGIDKTWQVWNTGEDKPLATVTGHTDHVYRATYNPTGTRVATIGYAGNVMIWDTASNGQLYAHKLPVKAGYFVAWSPDGRELAIATNDNRVLLLDVPASAQ